MSFFNDHDPCTDVVNTFQAQAKLVSYSPQERWDNKLTTIHVWSSEAAYDEFTSQPPVAAVFAARDSHNSANGITCAITTATI